MCLLSILWDPMPSPWGWRRGMEDSLGGSRCWRYSCEQTGNHSRYPRIPIWKTDLQGAWGLQTGIYEKERTLWKEMNKPAKKTFFPTPPHFKIKTSPWCQFQHTRTAGETSGISPESGPAEYIFPCHLNGQLLKSALCFNKRDLIKRLLPSPWWNNVVLAVQKTRDNVLFLLLLLLVVLPSPYPSFTLASRGFLPACWLQAPAGPWSCASSTERETAGSSAPPGGCLWEVSL